MEKLVSGVVIECQQGNIEIQPDMEVVVNAANAELRSGGGVAGAIHRAAGPELAQECRSLAPIKPGEAVLTQAFRLPNQYVIHCLGPVYGVDTPSDALLASCYRNALRLAEEKQMPSIAFPVISSGAFGFPLSEAGEVALRTAFQEAPHLQFVKRIRFVLYSSRELAVFEKTFSALVEKAEQEEGER